MAEKHVNLRFYYEGVFRKTIYSGGQTLLVNSLDVDEVSYTVLMEYVMDYLHYKEIGGVYVWNEKSKSWKLVKDDADLMELVNGCKNGGEISLYVDNVVDKEIEPLIQGQPHVVIRPRKNIVQVAANDPVKRTFVTTHQLQQQNKNKKIPKSPQLQELRQVPVITRGTAKRKLELQNDTKECKNTRENQIVELPPRVNNYELRRLKRVQENKEKFEELGLGKYAANPPPARVEESKTKKKDGEESDEYIVENESEDDTDDSSETIKPVKERKTIPGPRTRSRANTTDLGDKDPVHAIVDKGKQVATAREKEVPTVKLLKPTCSKLLKQGDKSVQSGTVAAYIALRERQKQNLEADPRIEDVGESSLPNANEEVKEAPKKYRGRTKMLKVHGRSADEKKVINLSNRGQPIGDKKLTCELSNFLGTLVKDHVSLTYINWHVVPEELKKQLMEYTLSRYVIPEEGEWWVNKTLNSLWRSYKSRTKAKHYTKYDNDEERIKNRPDQIHPEDFKMLMKYWSDEGVKSLAEDNKARRNSNAEPHTLGRKSLAHVRNKLKNKDPNLASPSNAQIYLKSRKRKSGRKYKSSRDVVQKRIDDIREMIKDGNDADVLLPRKKHRPDWLVGRQGKRVHSSQTPAISVPEAYVEELTAKITRNVESEMEAKVNRKVQENMVWFLKKLGDANPDMKVDVPDFCAAFSSDQDDNGTPITPANQCGTS